MVFENMQGENRFAGFEDVVVHSGGGSDTAILIELGSSDSLISVGDSVIGEIYGTDIEINGFKHVDWSAAVGQLPNVALAAVEEVYDFYGDV